jgi:phospholipid/cholesterol/gamma-HCH transport system substrate-binding protein
MTGQERREIIVGMAAFATFLVMLVVAYAAKHSPAGPHGAVYRIHATFNRIDGLRVGDQVQVSGVPVGTVGTMAIRPDYRADVILEIDRNIKLSSDTSAAIQTDGLFGGKFVLLEPGGDTEYLKDGGVLAYTQDAVIVSELLDMIIAEGNAARQPRTDSKP